MDVWSIIYPPEGERGIPSIDVSQIRRKFLDVPYALESPSQKLDIYLPGEGEGPFPALIFIHGGAFVFGNKRDTQFLHAIGGINRGYAVVSVEHRLGFEAQFPSALYDFKAAIRFLRANAVKYMIDGSRFASCGDSAGGYYAVMAAATQGNPAFEDLSMGNAEYSGHVQAVVSWYGAYDLVVQNNTRREDSPMNDPNMPDVELLLLGAHSKDIGGLMYFTNPLNFINRSFPPVFIHHGAEDHTVPVLQAYLLEEKVRTVCGADRVEMEIMEGFDHGGIDPRWYETKHADSAFRFLDKHLT
jgi:acetyl esterase/lipase